jgi:GntR family transcriptional regulator
MIVLQNYARFGAARRAILDILSSDEFSGTISGSTAASHNKLPSEEELSRRIGVSTGTVREALRMLQMEGVISKVHGSGNYFHRSTINLKMRMDLLPDYSDILTDAGFIVTRHQEQVARRFPDSREQETFGIKEEILSFDLVFTADGNNAIFTRNLIPIALLQEYPHQLDPQMNIMELLWRYGKERIANSIERMVPRIITPAEAELFSLPENRSVIAVNETFYSVKDHPIGYSLVTFNPEIVQMNFLRKWS